MIYFDMDGVLADFEGYYHDNNLRFDFDNHEEEGWDVVRNTPNFYAKLKPIPGALELFNKCNEKYGSEILSAIPKPYRNVPTAHQDKLDWLEQHLGKDVADSANICYRAEKVLLCKGPEDILIDDYDINIKEWEEKGGTGILFKNAEDAEKQLNEIMSKSMNKTKISAFEKMKNMYNKTDNNADNKCEMEADVYE